MSVLQAVSVLAAVGQSWHGRPASRAVVIPTFGFDQRVAPLKSFYDDGRSHEQRRDDRRAARKRSMRLRLRRGRS